MENLEKVSLKKKVYGLNTYSNAIDVSFTELIKPAETVIEQSVTVDQFFQYYENLFFNIPVSGSFNSHTYLVEKSQEYIGGAVIDAEKQALIEEINSLRQQLLSLNQNFMDLNNLS
jgi:hypothetical protein